MSSAFDPFPPNVHISHHPCVRAKLSQLRSKNADARVAKTLVHEISNILGSEALASALSTTRSGQVSAAAHRTVYHTLSVSAHAESKPQDESPLGYAFDTETVTPARISLVPILRSGLAMIDG